MAWKDRDGIGTGFRMSQLAGHSSIRSWQHWEQTQYVGGGVYKTSEGFSSPNKQARGLWELLLQDPMWAVSKTVVLKHIPHGHT